MTTLVQLPDAQSMTALVAGEVRAELARNRLSIRAVTNLAGGTYGYWHRRISGATALDVEDLNNLAQILGCSARDLLPPDRVDGHGPNGDGVGPVGLEPTTNGLEVPGFGDRNAVILTFPAGHSVPSEQAA